MAEVCSALAKALAVVLGVGFCGFRGMLRHMWGWNYQPWIYELAGRTDA